MTIVRKDSIRIYRATPGQLELLEELQRRASLANPGDRKALLEHPDAISLPLEQLLHGRVLVANSGNVTVGFAVVLAPVGYNSELDGLFVEPNAWRKGIGQSLVSACGELAKSEGARTLIVIANPHATAFYTSCGFLSEHQVNTPFGPAQYMRFQL